jgi:hypothetical protein
MKFILDGKELKVGDTLFYFGNSGVIEKRVVRLGRKYLYICNLTPRGGMVESVECRSAENKTWIVPSQVFSIHKDKWAQEELLLNDVERVHSALYAIESSVWGLDYERIADLRTALKTMNDTLRNEKETGNP